MSKAFTKEDDGGDVVLGRPVTRGGEPRPITKQGWAGLVAKLATIEAELGAVEAGTPRKAVLQHERDLCAATMSEVRIVEPPACPAQIVFGCTVVLEGAAGRKTLTLVGPDETDPKAGRISILSPVAQKLLGTQPGEEVDLPKLGPLTVLSITAHVHSP